MLNTPQRYDFFVNQHDKLMKYIMLKNMNNTNPTLIHDICKKKSYNNNIYMNHLSLRKN